MQSVALSLFIAALKAAALIALPIVGVVAVIGVIVGVLQTIVQVQDQNVSFAPKLGAVAVLVVAGGPSALAVLRDLLVAAIGAMPGMSRI